MWKSLRCAVLSYSQTIISMCYPFVEKNDSVTSWETHDTRRQRNVATETTSTIEPEGKCCGAEIKSSRFIGKPTAYTMDQVMSVDRRSSTEMRSDKLMAEKIMPSVIEEPEREVHSDAGELEVIQQTSENQKEENDVIAALRDAVLEQKKIISELQNHHVYRGGPPSSISDSFSHLTFNSDDDESIEFDDMDHELKDAIAAIRKEASQMDVVIALDQLATTRSELDGVVKALQLRCDEVEELKAQLEEKEDRLASLELERDLFEADARRVRDDLQKRSSQGETVEARSTSVPSSESTSMRESFSTETSQRDESLSDDGRPPLARRSSMVTPPRRVSVFLPTVEPASREIIIRPEFVPRYVPQKTGRFSPSKSNDAAKNFMDRTPPNFRSRPQFSSNSKPANVDDDLLFQSQVLSQISKTSKANRKIKKLFSADAAVGATRRAKADSEGETTRAPSLFRRRFGGQRASRVNEEQDSLLRAQVEAMKERLQASTHTSEELRKRLAMISRYYENIIRSLQENIVSLKAEKTRIEVDLTNQVSNIDHEKRSEVRRLENALIQKEGEIAKLQRDRSRLLI